MTIQLDEYEQDILDSVERGEWQSVPNLQQESDRYRSHAIAFTKFQMKSQINAGDKLMLKTYEAIIQDGQVKWLAEQPEFASARILITVVEDLTSKSTVKEFSKNQVDVKDLLELAGTDPDVQNIPRRRFPIAALAGKVKILGDIVSPIVDEEDWECLK